MYWSFLLALIFAILGCSVAAPSAEARAANDDAKQEFAVAEDDSVNVDEYLSKNNYLKGGNRNVKNVKNAIKAFQKYAGLRRTGKLDWRTKQKMKSKQCGIPQRQPRFNTGSKWPKTHLTYHLNYGDDLPPQTQDRVFREAFKFWSDQSTLTFSKARDPRNADLKISFGYGNNHAGPYDGRQCHGFDGPSGVLAHAYFPQDGRLHFDEAETYTDGSRGTNLLWVAAHEIGHALGIGHTPVRDAVMFAFYNYRPNFKLHLDDIKAIQHLYGRNTGGGGGHGGGGGGHGGGGGGGGGHGGGGGGGGGHGGGACTDQCIKFINKKGCGHRKLGKKCQQSCIDQHC